MSVGQQAEGDSRDVALTIPARPDYRVLARLALSAVCRLTPLSAEEIADLKLAITEAANDFVDDSRPDDDEGRLSFSFKLLDDRLLLELEGPQGTVSDVERELGRAIIDATAGSDIALVSFGSCDGAIHEAMDVLKAEGVRVNYMRVRAFPFTEDVERFLAAHRLVFVVEQNRDAQFRSLLTLETQVEKAKLRSLLHYSGLPISSSFIVEGVLDDRIGLILQLRHLEDHVQKVADVGQIGIGIGIGHSDTPPVRERLEGLGMGIPPAEQRSPEYLSRFVAGEIESSAEASRAER